MTVLDEICAYADRKLAGGTLTFALVVWCKGDAANPKSVSLSAPPAAQSEAPLALRTTAAAADPAGERLRTALSGLIAVRPENWDDEEDPEQHAAWLAAEEALA